eukprot:1157247-Pelagomonas_calceolata.AAC.13
MLGHEVQRPVHMEEAQRIRDLVPQGAAAKVAHLLSNVNTAEACCVRLGYLEMSGTVACA